MKYSAQSVLFFLCITALICACKKTELNTQPNLTARVNEKAKNWIEQQGTFGSAKYNFEDKIINIPEKINWEESKYFEESKTQIIPVIIESINGDLINFKYLVLNFDVDGKIIAGNYFIICSEQQLFRSYELKLITPEFFEFKKLPEDFEGTIIKYDINNNEILSKHYQNGGLTDKIDNILLKKSKTPIVPNYVDPGEGCEYVTIDWYWQTWVNGVLVSEIYIGSSQIIECSGGNGGGGGNGGNPLTCQQQNENYINEGISFSNGPVTVTDESNNGTIWIRSYNWPIYKAGFWALFSYDKGTLEKVTYPHNIERWEFQSFEHLHIAEVGTVIGGTRTFTDLGATINTTQTRVSVWEEVNYSVTSKVTCWPYPTTLAYNANKTFYAPLIGY